MMLLLEEGDDSAMIQGSMQTSKGFFMNLALAGFA